MDVGTGLGLLATTRSVRKRLDLTRAVPRELVLECVDNALQAPFSAHPEHWGNMAFLVVIDPEFKTRIADYHRAGMAARTSDGASSAQARKSDSRFGRTYASSMYLVEHLHEGPALKVVSQ